MAWLTKLGKRSVDSGEQQPPKHEYVTGKPARDLHRDANAKTPESAPVVAAPPLDAPVATAVSAESSTHLLTEKPSFGAFVDSTTPSTKQASNGGLSTDSSVPEWEKSSLGESSETASLGTPDGDEPTSEEKETLRHVSDRIPFNVWLVAGISLTERFTYYGINSPFQNYAQNPPGDPVRPGALGLGQSRATNLNDGFQFLVYLSPIAWAILADTKLGCYRSISIAVGIYLTGVSLIFVTSLPVALEHNVSLGGFVAGVIITGVGLGGLKACVPPFMADQYTETKLRVKTLKSKERVIIDRSLTLKSIYGLWYWCVNLGSLSGIATTWMERNLSFWAAYLLPTCFLFNAVILLLIGRRRFARRPPVGSILVMSGKIFSAASKAGFKMDATKPEYQLTHFNREVPWTDSFVDELKLGLVACQVFLAFPIAWLCHSQINTNLVSQAAEMNTAGIPNDTFQNLSALTVIIAMPLVQRFLYPMLDHFKIPSPPISRITAGFFFQAAAMGYAAIVQKVIYSTGPCYDMPLKCTLPNGATAGPNYVSVGLQVPAYIFDGLAGIFFYPTGQEYAYTKAPLSMKALVQSILMLTVAIGAALAFAFSPMYRDPRNVAMYATLAGIMGVTTVVFFWCLRKYNKEEDRMNQIVVESAEKEKEEAVAVKEESA